MTDLLHRETGTNAEGSLRYLVRFRPNGSSAPTNVGGTYIQSVTYSGTGTGIYLIQFNSNLAGILGFKHGVQSNTGGPAEGFSFEIDNAQTNLSAATPGAVIAVAGVNASGSRATIAADTNTLVFLEFVITSNATLIPV
jgi:hypothetical protein